MRRKWQGEKIGEAGRHIHHGEMVVRKGSHCSGPADRVSTAGYSARHRKPCQLLQHYFSWETEIAQANKDTRLILSFY